MNILTVARKLGSIAILTVLFLPLFAFSQNPKQQMGTKDETPLVFKSRVRHVLVPVIVHDHKNQHVSGLTKDDFTVLENGKPQQILSVDEFKSDLAKVSKLITTTVTPSTPDSTGNAGPVKAFTNELSGAQSQKRIIIILMDRINTKFIDQHNASLAVMKFLAKQTTGDTLIELLDMKSRGLAVVHDFTSDPRVLIRALEKETGERGNMENVDFTTMDSAPSASDIQSTQDRLDAFAARGEAFYAGFQQQNTVNATMEGFAHIAEAFAGIPGRKSLVWMTESFGMMLTDPNSEFPAFVDRSLFEKAIQKLSDANIAIYPVDVRGLVNAGFIDASQRVNINGRNPQASLDRVRTAQMNRHQDLIGTMNEIADMTGGKAFYNSNDLEGSIGQAQKDAQDYYLISYALDQSDTKPGWRKLKVKVRQDGINLRARQGFYMTAATNDPDKTRNEDMNEALDSPLDFTGMPLHAVIVGTKDLGNGKRRITYRVFVPPGVMTVDESDGNMVKIEAAYSVHDHRGNTMDRNGTSSSMKIKPAFLAQFRARDLAMENSISLPPGEFTLRFVVRDNINGRIGSVLVPLKVE